MGWPPAFQEASGDGEDQVVVGGAAAPAEEFGFE
jgi:hypothetical protein